MSTSENNRTMVPHAKTAFMSSPLRAHCRRDICHGGPTRPERSATGAVLARGAQVLLIVVLDPGDALHPDRPTGGREGLVRRGRVECLLDRIKGPAGIWNVLDVQQNVINSMKSFDVNNTDGEFLGRTSDD